MSILNKKTHDVCLVLDIGNASLAGSLTLFVPGLPPEALFTIRVPFTIGEHAHPEKLQSTLLSQLHDVLDTIHTKGFQHDYFKTHDKKIVKVLCVCASPWYVSKTKKVSVSNPKPFIITKSFLEDVMSKEVDVFTAELLSGVHGEEFKSGVSVMEKTVVDAKINGYSLHDPLGQTTNSCDITLYLGVHSTEITTAINSHILKFFSVGAQSILWHSFPLVAYSALQKIFPHENDYLLCDVTGEVTDITRVTGGVVRETVSFPSGKFFLVRKLMKTLSLPAEVAQSFLHLWQNKNASVEMEEKIKGALAEAESEWSIYLEDAFSSMGDIRALPQKMYLTSDTDVASIFMDFIKAPHTDATMLWRRGAQVVHLSEEVLSHFYVSGNHLTFDECVALDSIFLASFQ
ncbi:MAG: hypothetical protein RL292_307 [Candidatus Parcubacteria bacterium]|jgi:hypothetical protein